MATLAFNELKIKSQAKPDGKFNPSLKIFDTSVKNKYNLFIYG